jgi:hypothetical protein
MSSKSNHNVNRTNEVLKLIEKDLIKAKNLKEK